MTPKIKFSEILIFAENFNKISTESQKNENFIYQGQFLMLLKILFPKKIIFFHNFHRNKVWDDPLKSIFDFLRIKYQTYQNVLLRNTLKTSYLIHISQEKRD